MCRCLVILFAAVLLSACGGGSEAPVAGVGDLNGTTITTQSQRNDLYAQRMAQSIMNRRPESYGGWNYETATVLRGFEELYKATGDEQYLTYLKSTVDRSVGSDGDIAGYSVASYNLDQIKQGSAVLYLYTITGQSRYKLVADSLMDQLDSQPQTSEGGNWHKQKYPDQMWLDGLYMAQPFNARYGVLFDREDNLDDVVKQLTLMEQRTLDEATGLLYHGWDESKRASWADNNGRSPVLWARSIGWYVMALVDVLDHIPLQRTVQREQIIAILNRQIAAIAAVQDNTTGAWWQVPDRPGERGNWLESSATAMFVYTIAKAVRLDYIDADYLNVADRGWAGLVGLFVTGTDSLSLTDTCEGTGVRSNYSFYAGRDRRTNDPKGLGPFLLAGVEMELLGEARPVQPPAADPAPADDDTDPTESGPDDGLVLSLQAEDRLTDQAVSWYSARVENSHTGYTGSGYVNTDNLLDSWYEFTVTAPATGNYALTIRYANGSDPRPASLFVNDTLISAGPGMLSTDSWDNWVDESVVITLYRGDNTVRLMPLTSAGLANLDRLEIYRQ